MRRSNANADSNTHTLKLEQVYSFKAMIPQSMMTHLYNAMLNFNGVQAHRGLVPIDSATDVYEVLIQVSAVSREDALSTAFLLGSNYVAFSVGAADASSVL